MSADVTQTLFGMVSKIWVIFISTKQSAKRCLELPEDIMAKQSKMGVKMSLNSP